MIGLWGANANTALFVGAFIVAMLLALPLVLILFNWIFDWITDHVPRLGDSQFLLLLFYGLMIVLALDVVIAFTVASATAKVFG